MVLPAACQLGGELGLALQGVSKRIVSAVWLINRLKNGVETMRGLLPSPSPVILIQAATVTAVE